MNELVELQIGKHDAASPKPGSATDGSWKPVVLNVLRVLCEAAPHAHSKETTDLCARLVEHRRVLGGNMHPQEERQEAADTVATCEKYLRRIQSDQTAREHELTEMIRLLRDATTRLIGESSDFNAAVQSSADRFNEINKIDDLSALKRELSSEVSTLQHAVEEKKQRDSEAMSKLSQQVEVLQADLVKAEEKATTDPLTRVANRGGFDRSILKMMEMARKTDTPLTLAMVDIDHFKKVNDTWGHQVGDRVLLCCAEWLRNSVRRTDFIARYGGEEFAVLLYDADLKQAEARFQAVLEKIAGRSYEFDDDGASKSIRFTVSCGVSQMVDGDTDKDLIKRADQALYEAKDKGRNRVVTKKVSRLARFLSRN